MKRLRAWAAAAFLAFLPFTGVAQQQPPQQQQPQQIRHTVVAGDTLMSIAKRHLGDPALWLEVKRANAAIRDERRLRLGSTVLVPLPAPGPVAVHVNGKASFTRQGQTRALTQGTQLQERDTVDVEQASYVTLRWREGMVTHLLPGSSLRFVRPASAGAEPRPHVLELKSGTAESQVPQGQGGMSFQIRTRLGTAAVRGTGFGVRLADAMVTDVTEGNVGLAGQGFRPLDLAAGFGAVADASGGQPQPVPLLPAPEIEPQPFYTTDGFVRGASVAGAARYEFELAPAQSPDATLRRAASDTPEFPLMPLREGLWRVRMRAVDGAGIPGFPATRNISAIAFPAPEPRQPPDNALVGDGLPGRFLCSEAARATSYEIEFHSLDAQREPVRVSVAPYCEGALPQLPPGRYRWRAFALLQQPGVFDLRSQPGPWSHFTVVPSPPVPAPQLRPGGGVQQILEWEGTQGARYVVQVSLDTGFTRLLSDITVDAPQVAVSVQPGRTVYVRIRAIAANGVGSDFSQPMLLRGAQ